MTNTVFMEGYRAWHADIDACPYKDNTDQQEAWDAGWLAAEEDET